MRCHQSVLLVKHVRLANQVVLLPVALARLAVTPTEVLGRQIMPTLILLGPRCSGKNTVADYLVSEEGFERVRITSSSWASTSKQRDGDSLVFSTASDFLDYATLNWRKRYVTCDRMSRADLDGFVKRPWVLLVGCEARMAWRWKRRNEL